MMALDLNRDGIIDEVNKLINLLDMDEYEYTKPSFILIGATFLTLSLVRR